jgi:hypothetical protein
MIRDHRGGDARFDWREDGLVCEIAIPGDKLEPTAEIPSPSR